MSIIFFNRKMRLTLFVIFLAFPFLAFPAGHAAAQSDSSEIVKKLLVEHWDKNKTNREVADSLLRQSSGDRGVLLSYSLQRIQQNRKKDAVKSIASLTANYPDDIDGWMLKTWLDTVTDDFDRALLGMLSLKKAVDDPAAKVDDVTKRQVLRRMGRMIGYFSGPVKTKVNDDVLDHAIAGVTAGLAADDLKLVNEQRDRVLAEFEQMTKNRDAKKTEVTVKAQADANVKKQQLEQANKVLDDQQEKITPQIERLEEQAQQRVTNLRSEITPLESAGARVNVNIANVENNLNFLQFEIFRLQALRTGDAAQDIFIDQQIRFSLNRLRFIRFDLRQLYAERDSIYNQIDGIGSQIVATQNRVGGQINNLNGEIANVNREKRRNIKQIGKISAAPSRRAASKVGALDERARAFSTYDSFPIELFRQKMMDRFLK